MKFAVKNPIVQVKQVERSGAQYRKDLRTATISATDRASKDAQRDLQARIRAVGLGRLGGAVGQTSMKREGYEKSNWKPFGVIFARGGDESLGGGALESYSRGSRITPQGGNQWLWIPQAAIPRYVSMGGRRFRTTPQLYNHSNLVSSIGKLEFKPIGGNRALLVIRKASVNIRTGRARSPIKRKSSVSTNEKDVIAFVGIKRTSRIKRFDKDDVVKPRAQRMPIYIQEELARIRGRRA